MKTILKSLLVLSLATVVVFGQQPWVKGDIKGQNIFMTGKVSTALADTATCDTTAATSTMYSAVFQQNAYLLSGKNNIRFGIFVIDTAKAGTTTTAPTVIMGLQGSLDGTNFKTITGADTILNAVRFYTPSLRTGAFISGALNLGSVKYPYYRLYATPSATLGTASVSASVAQIKTGKFRWVIIP